METFTYIPQYKRPKTDEILDEINFEIPYGRVGKLFEGYAYTQLQKLFDREAATIRTLQGNR